MNGSDAKGRKWTAGRAHAAAVRYMFKLFIRDLWKVWRAGAAEAVPERASAPLPPPAIPAARPDEGQSRPAHEAGIGLPEAGRAPALAAE